MDENKEVNSTDPKREKVRVIPLSAIDDAPDHPFGVRDDEEMAELVESISTFGVINPVIVRKGEGERYELISGHRRKYACAKLGIETLPVIVRDLSREEAIIFMVDSNLQREHILPSERAKAYQMLMKTLAEERGLPLYCYGYLPTTGEEIRIDFATSGYTPYRKLKSDKEVKEINREIGVTPAQAEAMKVGSMFGWKVPGADPKSYDEKGKPIPPRSGGER